MPKYITLYPRNKKEKVYVVLSNWKLTAPMFVLKQWEPCFNLANR